MSYSFCFGPSGSGKSRLLRQMVISRARASLADAAKDHTRYIIIVPEQYSMQTQRDLVQDHPSHVLMNIDVLSFGRLAHRVFEETGVREGAVLDDIGKSLVLRRVASRCADRLQILRRGIHRPGMIDEVKSVLSEFMQYGVGAPQIEEMAEFARSRGQAALEMRLRDLGILYQEFQKEKADQYRTSEEILTELAIHIPHAASLRGSVIVFDGFTGFTTVQYRVVLELIRCAGEVIFSFTVSGDQGPDIRKAADGGRPGSRDALFYLSRKTVYDIVRMADREKLPRGKDIYLMDSWRFSARPALAHLERHLFRYPEIPFQEEKGAEETAKTLRLFAASTPQEEVRQTFAGVRRLIARTGCAYRDISIVTADLETYGDLFEREAARSGIPVYIDRTSGAFHNILIEGIRSVLQISAESFSYASVFRYLRSGLSNLTNEEADRLENYCLAAGIRGRRKWASPFDASCEEARIRFLREVEPVTGLSPDEKAFDQEAQSTPSTPRRARTAAERTRELYLFLTGCGAQARMEDLASSFGEAGDVVREKQYRQIYRAVIDLLDQIHSLTGQERMGARDYLELLEAGFSQIRLGTIPQRVDRILVGDIERTRLTQVRHLFIAGVNEGNIPRSAARGGILSDMDREFLAGGKVELAPSPRQQIFTQRLYLYLNMTKPSETLTVSFARTSQEGKSLRPSYLISRLRALFPSLRLDLPEELPPAARVTSARDGLHLLADGLRGFVETGLRPGPLEKDSFSILYGFFTSSEMGQDPRIRACVRSLRRAALCSYRPELISAGLARAIYGDRIVGGISRMETGAKCLLEQHLRYGLHLRERDLYEISYADTGNILHLALQRFDRLLQEEGLSWRTFTAGDAKRLTARALEEEAAVYRSLILYKTARDQSLLLRYGRRLQRTVDTLQYQLLQGDFDPAASELSFGGQEGRMPAIRYDLGAGRALVLIGRIDRVDLCIEYPDRNPGDGARLFFRIMDFKSGKKDLDPDKIRRGLQLQLITYMQALLHAGPGPLRALAEAAAGGQAEVPIPGQTAADGSGADIAAAGQAGAPVQGQDAADGTAADGSGVEIAADGPAEIIPSAMLYYQIREPVIDLSAEEIPALSGTDRDGAGQDAEDAGPEPVLPRTSDLLTGKIRGSLRPTGLVYEDEESIVHLDKYFDLTSDTIPVKRKKGGGYAYGSRTITPEEFRDLSQAASDALCRIARSILDGEAPALPARLQKQKTACDECPFREACSYDPRIPGYYVRND